MLWRFRGQVALALYKHMVVKSSDFSAFLFQLYDVHRATSVVAELLVFNRPIFSGVTPSKAGKL